MNNLLSHSQLLSSFSNQHFVLKTQRQIAKDFAKFNLFFPENFEEERYTKQAIEELVSEQVAELMKEGETRLLQLLYTIDLSEKEFEAIAGTYTEKEKGYTVTISSDGQNAMFQNAASGQMYFPITYKGKNTFEYEEIKLEFFPATKELRLQQGAIEEHYLKLSE